MSFGDKLRKLMRSSGLTQESVAESLGTTQSVVNRWVGGMVPRVPTLLRLARMLDTTVDYLVDDARDSPAPSEFTDDERQIIRFVRDTGMSREEVLRRLAMMPATIGRPLDPGTGEPLAPPGRAKRKA